MIALETFFEKEVEIPRIKHGKRANKSSID